MKKLSFVKQLHNELYDMVEASFPALHGYQLYTQFIHRYPAFATCKVRQQEKDILIRLNYEDIHAMNQPARMGLLAHELCHAEVNVGLPPDMQVIQAWLYNFFLWERIAVERDTDARVLEKGYGQQLLALYQYEKERHKEYSSHVGLTVDEVQAALTNSALIASFRRTPQTSDAGTKKKSNRRRRKRV